MFIHSNYENVEGDHWSWKCKVDEIVAQNHSICDMNSNLKGKNEKKSVFLDAISAP